MPRRTKEEAAKTRALIMQTAERLFFDQGVARTTLQDIAQAANVTRGAVYWHFKDKVDLLWAIADDVYMPHEALLDNLVSMEAEDPVQALYKSCRETLNSIMNSPNRRRVFTIIQQKCENIEEMALLHRRNDVCRDRLLERLTTLFQQARSKGMLAEAWAPVTAALALQTLTIGFINIDMEYPRPSRKRDTMRNEVLDCFFRSLRAKGSA